MTAKHPKALRLALLPVCLMALAGFSLSTHAQDTAAEFSKGSVQLGYDNQTCDASLEGSLRYNSGGDTVELCTIQPLACTVIGELCADNTYYIGLSPDGNVPMFMADSSSQGSESWNSGTSNWTTTGFTSATDGNGNTAGLVLADSDSVTGGVQPHPAAVYCDDLVAYGYDDWYLPAKDELNMVYNSGSPLGDLTPTSTYWTSSEVDSQDAWRQRMDDGFQFSASNTKSLARPVRCFRQGGGAAYGWGAWGQ